MLKLCGKAVRSLRTPRGKTYGQSSPERQSFADQAMATCEKVMAIHSFTQYFPLPSSTRYLPLIPLNEYIFYPVSTTPTITSIKGK